MLPLTPNHQPQATDREFLSERRRSPSEGFSLVEVVLAIGIVAFAFVAIFSLLPVGMGVFREAMETSVGAQISQRIVTDAQESDFDNLVNNARDGDFFALPMRFFDDQGTEVQVPNPTAPSQADLQRLNVLYTARVRGSIPGQGFTSLPSTTQRFSPRGATYLTIQIARNPGGKPLAIDKDHLIDVAKARTDQIRLQTYSVVLARQSYPLP